MPSDYVKFLKKGFHGERLRFLKSDGLRWRWWRLYCLSDQETFPGLIAKGLTPLSEMTIVGELYQSDEFKDVDHVGKWRQEKKVLLESELIKQANVNSHEFIWNVDFHSYQDKLSKKGAQLKDRFYSSFADLNERDKVSFIVLISRFAPSGVDLEAFFIPKYLKQFEAYADKKLPLFDKSTRDALSIKGVLQQVSESLRKFQIERKTGSGNSDVRQFMEWYCAKFKETTGHPYSVSGKDFKLVSEMFKLFSLGELKKLGERFFREPDQFVKRAGYTVGVFRMMLNRLVSVGERTPIGLGDYSKYRR